MKKKILALVVSFSMVFTMLPAAAAAATETQSADGVAINANNFPDENFRNVILDETIDKDGNQILSNDEAKQVTNLDVSGKSISNLKGIEYFTDLSELDFSSNANLTSLDLSKNTVLTKVKGNSCSSLSSLTGLSASADTLTSLECTACSLTTLDLTQNTRLNTVNLTANPWIAVNIPENASGWKISNARQTWTTDLSWLVLADYGIIADNVTELEGGTIRDGMLIPNNSMGYNVFYTYKCNASETIMCKINFKGRAQAQAPGGSTNTNTSTNTGGSNANTNTNQNQNTGGTAAGTTSYSKDPAAKSAKPTLAKVTSVKAKAGKKKATISWKKVNGANGYKIYRATKKNGKYKVVKTIKKQKTVKFTNKKLAKGKTYYYKVRAYKKVNGKTVYGKYSKVVKAKAK